MTADPRAMTATASRKRLPPYGRELMQMREAGLVPANETIVVGLDTWNYGRAFARCVIPPDLEPADCNLAFVAGLDVIVVYEPARTMPERRAALVRELLRMNPTTLRTVAMGDPIEWKWVKSRAVGIELTEFAA